MEKLKTTTILFIAIILLTSCSNNNEDIYPYYQFNAIDKTFLIKYDYVPNQIIIYENQFGEQLKFKVLLNEQKKRKFYSNGTFSGGGGYLQNFYDNKIITLEILENLHYNDYSKVNYYFSMNGGSINCGINFPMWNSTIFGSIDELNHKVNIFSSEYFDYERMQININGHDFNNTIVISSNSNDSNNVSSFGPLPQNIYKIYYDYDFGIVQFIDIDGKEWKVIYPE